MSKHKQKLFSSSSPEHVSPLIDVVMNGFAVMFIIVVVLLVIKQQDPIRFLRQFHIPPAVPGESFTFTLPAEGGQGVRQFEILEGELEALNLRLDRSSGTIVGTPRVEGSAQGSPTKVAFLAEVRDEGGNRDRTKFEIELWEGKISVPEIKPVKLTHQSEALASGWLATPYEAVIGATNLLGEYVAYLAPGDQLPPGLEFDPIELAVRGTPKEAGTYRFTVKVETGPGAATTATGRDLHWNGSEASRTFEIKIHGVLEHSLALPEGREGQDYFGAIVTGPRPPGSEIEVSGLPSGLNFDPKTGAISGVAESSGEFQVTYQLKTTDEVLAQGSGALELLPMLPAQDLETLTAHLEEGAKGRVPIAYRGLIEPVHIETTSALPSGLKIQGNGLEGIAREAGVYPVSVTITDAKEKTMTQDIQIRVAPAAEALQIPTSLTVYSEVGKPLVWAPPASGGESALQWEFLEGGAAFGHQVEGVMTTQFDEPGSTLAVVSVWDPLTKEQVQSAVTFRSVLSEESMPSFRTPGVTLAALSEPFRYAPAVDGGVGVSSIRVEGELPAGVIFEENVLTGIPQSLGQWPLRFVATDEAGHTASSELVTVKVTKDMPEQGDLQFLSRTVLPPGLVGQDYDLFVAVSDAVGTLRITKGSNALPPGMEFLDGRLHGKPEKAGDYRINLTATDSLQRKTQKFFQLNVLDPKTIRPQPSYQLWKNIRGKELLAAEDKRDVDRVYLRTRMDNVEESKRELLLFLGKNRIEGGDLEVIVAVPRANLRE